MPLRPGQTRGHPPARPSRRKLGQVRAWILTSGNAGRQVGPAPAPATPSAGSHLCGFRARAAAARSTAASSEPETHEEEKKQTRDPQHRLHARPGTADSHGGSFPALTLPRGNLSGSGVIAGSLDATRRTPTGSFPQTANRIQAPQEGVEVLMCFREEPCHPSAWAVRQVGTERKRGPAQRASRAHGPGPCPASPLAPAPGSEPEASAPDPGRQQNPAEAAWLPGTMSPWPSAGPSVGTSAPRGPGEAGESPVGPPGEASGPGPREGP